MHVDGPDLGAVGKRDPDQVPRVAGDESRGNDSNFALSDRRAWPDRNDLCGPGDAKLGDMQLHALAHFDPMTLDPLEWPEHLDLDGGQIVFEQHQRDLPPVGNSRRAARSSRRAASRLPGGDRSPSSSKDR